MNDNRTNLIAGTIAVGSWVVVTGPRFNGRKGKVISIGNGTYFVRGSFGGYAFKGRCERGFGLEQLSLYTDDMDESTREAH